MKKYTALLLAITCIIGLFGCGKQEQQGDNNMQYFFGGKVIEAETDYLILEVFDTGNSNLSEGVNRCRKCQGLSGLCCGRICKSFNGTEYG